MINKRYIFDSLYGVIHLPDFIWELLTTPELQRLREIRLCNINSLCLTGGANVNRYEHAIGTCYLAIKCYESWLFKKSLTENQKKCFLIAALFHDVANAAFGHSIEYVEGYKPENSFFDILLRRKGEGFTSNRAHFDVVFFGLVGTLHETLIQKFKLTETDLKTISDAMQGEGIFGPLISNSIDLDNIDNVYRMAYHLGLVDDKTIPLKLATSLIIDNNKLKINDNCEYLLEDWFKTRKLLYEFLLLNPDEFSGKSMLTEAIENSKEIEKFPFRWFDTDFELLKKLSQLSSENAILIPRLMTGDLYGCISILSTEKTEAYKDFTNTKSRRAIEKEIESLIRNKYSNLKSALISIHPILDVNKTERIIKIETISNKYLEVGYPSKQLLLGVFFKNKDLNMNRLRNDFRGIASIQDDIVVFLKQKLQDNHIKQLELYDEAKGYK